VVTNEPPDSHRTAAQRAITVKHLERRAFSYAGAGVAQIWLPFLEAEVLANADERPGGKDGNWVIARYPAPRWQRWLHGYKFRQALVL
jgi:hypothetical protein